MGLVTAKKKIPTGIALYRRAQIPRLFGALSACAAGKNHYTVDGDEIGEHQGLMYHTLGQRKGLGIGGTKTVAGHWYVVDKTLKTMC
ncbi:hypothetical protein KCP69_13690 [Salmonella enterica subsp. enterica]|nr:hypothetical protein KCP69_13690 [Salmonella enterica subsp. enterica]